MNSLRYEIYRIDVFFFNNCHKFTCNNWISEIIYPLNNETGLGISNAPGYLELKYFHDVSSNTLKKVDPYSLPKWMLR